MHHRGSQIVQPGRSGTLAKPGKRLRVRIEHAETVERDPRLLHQYAREERAMDAPADDQPVEHAGTIPEILSRVKLC